MSTIMDTVEPEGKELCPQCFCLLGNKSVRANKRLHYDASSGQRLKKRHVHIMGIEDDEIGLEVGPQQWSEKQSHLNTPYFSSTFTSSLGDRDCFDENDGVGDRDSLALVSYS